MFRFLIVFERVRSIKCRLIRFCRCLTLNLFLLDYRRISLLIHCVRLHGLLKLLHLFSLRRSVVLHISLKRLKLSLDVFILRDLSFVVNWRHSGRVFTSLKKLIAIRLER